jgi:hypothetical protein
MQRKPGSMRIVDRDEFNAGVHERGYKGQVAGQTVELGDH